MAEERRPAVDYLKISDAGTPYLEGYRCRHCNAVRIGVGIHCGKCWTRYSMAPVRLRDRGVLHTYCIVHRSFPGVAVPYVSAIVDLDGGGTVKGTLIGVEPQPEKIAFGMAVDVVYGDALGRRDADGNAYLAYFFRPRFQPGD